MKYYVCACTLLLASVGAPAPKPANGPWLESTAPC